MKRKKLKCVKCGIYFKDREDEGDSEYEKKSCFKCGFILHNFKILLSILGKKPDLNRNVKLNLEDIEITKRKKA